MISNKVVKSHFCGWNVFKTELENCCPQISSVFFFFRRHSLLWVWTAPEIVIFHTKAPPRVLVYLFFFFFRVNDSPKRAHYHLIKSINGQLGSALLLLNWMYTSRLFAMTNAETILTPFFFVVRFDSFFFLFLIDHLTRKIRLYGNNRGESTFLKFKATPFFFNTFALIWIKLFWRNYFEFWGN